MSESITTTSQAVEVTTPPDSATENPATKPAGGTSASEADGWGLFLLVCIIGAALYGLDQQYFASRRPWNLLLFLAQLGVIGVSAVCFVLVMIRLCQSDDRVLGVVSALLTPVFGLGALIAFIWGWKEMAKRDPESGGIMVWWSGSMIVQIIILLYIWGNPQKPLPDLRMGGSPANHQGGGSFGSQQQLEQQRQRDLQRDLMEIDREAQRKEADVRRQQQQWEMEKRLMDNRYRR